ncbi:MAG TPA: glycosyltransferase family 2 protein [Anaeromyxobacter sp.]
MRSVDLVLIARNEEAGVRTLLDRIDRSLFRSVLAIDGHSTDRTRELLEAAGIPVHVQRRPGLGAAMLEARELVSADAFVFFHPDGNEDPADLGRMVALLASGHEFVVASRMIAGAWNEEDHLTFRWRKWANQGFALLANSLFAHGGNRTSDVTNGFRGIACATFDRMRLTSTDLTMDYQMVIRALKLGLPITEFPTRESVRIGGETNFHSVATGIAELKLVWREVRNGRRGI